MTDIAVLSKHLQQRLQAALTPDERLVWVGQPIARHYMKREAYQVRVVFAAMVVCGLLWIVGGLARTLIIYGLDFDFLPLIGVPFLLIGVRGLRSPSDLKEQARFVVYAITSERVILLGGDDPETIRTYRPVQLQQIERTEHAGGWGDLILETEHEYDGDSYTTNRHGMLGIGGVRRVHGLIAALAKTLPLAPNTPHASFQQCLITPDIGPLPDKLRQALRAEMAPDERLVWAAQPIPGSYLKRGLAEQSFFIVWTLFSLVLTGFLAPAMWASNRPGDIAPLMMLCVPLMFLSIGIYHLYQPFKMRKAALSVVHAITSGRALTIDASGPLVTRTYAPAGLVHADCIGGRADSGDLLLEPASEVMSRSGNCLQRYGFLGIDEVRHVERLIGHLKQAPVRPSFLDKNWYSDNAL
ncbi:hypothetical protein PO883_11875 [Massilia sp. DJPM01]|uniref:hypothetical protein n=1 Tax=Massilia sp. DJPM01 TaxID=3024404 RepID=UPI00259E9AC0|nr:hypothetical protein [Massilia sp. DJPM01]MDM5177890.1 hypothetical protein [Massilia sp. DJPM01]